MGIEILMTIKSTEPNYPFEDIASAMTGIADSLRKIQGDLTIEELIEQNRVPKVATVHGGEFIDGMFVIEVTE